MIRSFTQLETEDKKSIVDELHHQFNEIKFFFLFRFQSGYGNN